MTLKRKTAAAGNVKKDKLRRLQQVTDKAADVLEEALANSDAKALKDAVAALKELVNITRDVYDMPTAAQKQTLLLNLKKLEGESKQSGDGESETGVIEIARREEGGVSWPET